MVDELAASRDRLSKHCPPPQGFYIERTAGGLSGYCVSVCVNSAVSVSISASMSISAKMSQPKRLHINKILEKLKLMRHTIIVHMIVTFCSSSAEMRQTDRQRQTEKKSE